MVSGWGPTQAPVSQGRAFHELCQYEEAILHERFAYEKRNGLHNFSPGLRFEAHVRDTVRRILPQRYTVSAGEIQDDEGMTAGDCDIVIHDHQWYPTIKHRVADDDRHQIISAESVYGVLEVKTTLTPDTLDDAMKKLVTVGRLHRERCFLGQITENRELGPGLVSAKYLDNPMFTAIITTGLGTKTSQDEILRRFVEINKQLGRDEVVRSICVLKDWCTVWAAPDRPPHLMKDPATAQYYIANFQGDREQELVLGGPTAVDSIGQGAPGNSAFTILMGQLLDNLTTVTLRARGFAYRHGAYGSLSPMQPQHELTLTPD